jgi:inorganic pyrophosphatase
MIGDDVASVQRLMGLMFRAHPWHGVSIGEDAPEVVTAYIEIVPTDTVKYEVDKVTGFLKVDRPQRFSNLCPVYYGLIPQTYCGERVAGLFATRANRKHMIGDGDPLDICVLTEKTIPHSDILLTALPIGGLSMSDGGEAGDKIIAVMKDDAVYGASPISPIARPLSSIASSTASSRTKAPPGRRNTKWRSPTCTAVAKPSR